MQYECIVLDIARSDRGESVILDFPPEIPPHVGMELKDYNSNRWKMNGMGMPVILDVLENKILTYYSRSKMVWDCLLLPVEHNVILEKGVSLVVVSN